MNHKSFEEYIKDREGMTFSMPLDELASLCHSDAVALGWYDTGKQRTDLESIMMMVTELAEAVEELRKPNPQIEYHNQEIDPVVGLIGPCNPKPEGVGVELADCLIRLLDYCAYKDIDIEGIVERKLNYNITRGYRHGNKRY